MRASSERASIDVLNKPNAVNPIAVTATTVTSNRVRNVHRRSRRNRGARATSVFGATPVASLTHPPPHRST
ncbi:hypothetical protein GCM10027167_16240 [Nocardia heshunensis]